MIKSKKIKIVFFIPRLNHFRVLGSIIEVAYEDREVEPVIVLVDNRLSQKGEQAPSEEKIPEQLRGKCKIKSFSDIGDCFRYCDEADIFFTLNRVWETHRGKCTKPIKALWCTIYDTLDQCFPHYKMENTWRPEYYSEYSDLYFWPTPYYRDLAIHWNLAPESILNERSRFVGFVRSDFVKRASREDIRRKYSIPLDKPVVIFIPDQNKLRSSKAISVTHWYFDLWLAENQFQRICRSIFFHRSISSLRAAISPTIGYDRALSAISKFCKNNGALLVMAPRRRKDWRGEEIFTSQEKRIADHLIETMEEYPQSLLQLFGMADLVISPIYTDCVLDSSAMGTPFVSLKLSGPVLVDDFLPDFEKIFTERAHFPGVTWEIQSDEFIRNIPNRPLSYFSMDSKTLQTFNDKYVGPADGMSSERIIEEAKGMVGS